MTVIALALLAQLAGGAAGAQPSSDCVRTQQESGLIDPEIVCALERAGWGWKGFDAVRQSHLLVDADGTVLDLLPGLELLYHLEGESRLDARGRDWNMLDVMLGDRSDPAAVAAFERADIALPEGDPDFASRHAEEAAAIAVALSDLFRGRPVPLDQTTLIAALHGANAFAGGCGLTPPGWLDGLLGAFNLSSVAGLSAARGYAAQAERALAVSDAYDWPPCSGNGVSYLQTLSDSLPPTFDALADTPFIAGCAAANRPAACRCAFAALLLHHDDLAQKPFERRLLDERFRALGFLDCRG